MDEEKMTFISNWGLYYYQVMNFSLNNEWATYQRLVNKIFKDQIDRNIEVYVDDLLVKTKAPTQHTEDLSESFSILRQYKMKLDLVKCAFDVDSRNLLCFLVPLIEIEANVEKIRNITQMEAPWSINEVQRLIGRVATLNRFMPKVTNKCFLFFGILWKAHSWKSECDLAFMELKWYLFNFPLMS